MKTAMDLVSSGFRCAARGESCQHDATRTLTAFASALLLVFAHPLNSIPVVAYGPGIGADGQTQAQSGCNAPPCELTLRSSGLAEPFVDAESELTPITNPAEISPQTVYDFSLNAEDSTPTSFPDGTFAGTGTVELVGSGWLTWNPQIDGKHVLAEWDGLFRVNFTNEQQAVGVVAEPEEFSTFDVTIEAFDSSGTSLGSFATPVVGNSGAAFVGLASSTPNIAAIEISTPPESGGFALSDLTYGRGPTGPACGPVRTRVWRAIR